MKIAQFTPGAGDNIYCENCLRDAALMRAFQKLGHEVLMIPLYLPLRVDGAEQLSDTPIFFGGINVYLQQKSAIFRKTPRWIDKIFDMRKLLEWASGRSGMVDAHVLGTTTISMLQGEDGRQVKELERLVDWLGEEENKPDIVVLSNALLAGMAGRIKEKIGVPVVCMLQDEAQFLDDLTVPYNEQAWEILSERVSGIETFIAVSNYYADVMTERLKLDGDKIHVVYPGIELDRYEPAETKPEIPTIGFLSQMSPGKGLDILVDAFVLIKRKEGLENTKLYIAGRRGEEERSFIESIERKLRENGLTEDVQIMLNFGHKEKVEFLQKLSVLSVPERHQSAYGLYLIEALATGVPVVEPATGVFNELLEKTGGGLLYEPNDAFKLAETIEKLLLDKGNSKKLGEQGRMSVIEKFNIEKTSDEMANIFMETIKIFSEKNHA
ncbi:MAG: glycosyltransferase family 4 protein [Planctomycetota bacterium]|jgi:glycosyltransferase involved in cell wall biosynthesis